jgi:hypothetical protein
MHKPKPMPMHKPKLQMHKPKLQMHFLLLLRLNNQDNQDNQDNPDNNNPDNQDNQAIQPIHPSCRPTEEKEEARRAKKVFVVARTSPRPEENTPPSADPANNGLIIFEIFSNIPKIEFQNGTN